MRHNDLIGNDPISAMLKRRGFPVLLKNPTEYLFFPPDLDKPFEDELYQMLKKYSFRIFIRDVIKNRKSFSAEDLLKYTTREWVEKYTAFLLERGVIDAIGEGLYKLRSEAVFSFGDTLEWFVANAFEREFSSPSIWGVRLGNVPVGGDYDVIADVEGGLVYVELKSSPPKNVEAVDIEAFLKRVAALKPSLAIFLEDTTLRMKDKIVPLFEAALEGRGLPVRRVQNETFSIGDKVFITNSDPDIIGNIGLCLKLHLSHEEFW